MKKHILFLFAGLLLAPAMSRCATFIINTADYDFTPSNLTVDVGDTLVWMWQNGVHTTTSSAVPVGAAVWDAPLTATATSFTYITTVPGSYNYVCTPHVAMGMTGQFTVLSGMGIEETAPPISLLGYETNGDNLLVNYYSSAHDKVTFQLYNILGNKVYQVIIADGSGVHSHAIDASSFSKGIYVLNMFVDDFRLTRRLVIE